MDLKNRFGLVTSCRAGLSELISVWLRGKLHPAGRFVEE